MKDGPRKILLSIVTAAAAVGSAPAIGMGEQELRELDRKCEEARTAALAPIRAKLARECEQSRPRSPDPRQECQVELSTYGNSRTGARGNVIPGLFYDLPECKAAQAAWAEWDKSRPWK